MVGFIYYLFLILAQPDQSWARCWVEASAHPVRLYAPTLLSADSHARPTASRILRVMWGAISVCKTSPILNTPLSRSPALRDRLEPQQQQQQYHLFSVRMKSQLTSSRQKAQSSLPTTAIQNNGGTIQVIITSYCLGRFLKM